MIPKEAKVHSAYYNSVGPMLNVDALTVEFEIDDEIYTHDLPNTGWSDKTAALAFMGFFNVKPSDFEGSKIEFDSKYIPVQWNREQDQYMITENAIILGSQLLKATDWFNPEGEVADSGENQGVGGMNVEPGTGNQGLIENEEEVKV